MSVPLAPQTEGTDGQASPTAPLATPASGQPEAASTGATGANGATGDSARVAETLRVLARAFRAHQLYMANNPVHVRAMELLRDSLTDLLATLPSVELRVTEDDFLYDDLPVFTEGARGSEGLPRLFHTDGIRSFEMREGFQGNELVKFLDALRATRNRGPEDDDLVTLFWECDFANFTYAHVEAGGDGYDAPGANLLSGGAPKVGETKVRPDSEQDGGVYSPGASPFARIADFDSTLYFLEESEVAYLQDAISEDFSGDLRPSVVAALLDTFEAQDDTLVRDEICGVLESFLVTLLSTLQFSSATYLLHEAAAAVSRVPTMSAAHRARLTDLVRHMSDPHVLEQLLATLEDAPRIPAQDDLVALLTQLDSQALPPLVSHLVRTQNEQLRPLLERAASRVAASNTSELVMLLDAPDEMVVLEAVRRAGALRIAPAVQGISRLLDSPSVDVRRTAAFALAEIGTPGAMQGLERAIDDADRAVRVSAVLALAQRQYRIALPRIERAVRGPILRDGTGPERAAFFESYALLARDAAIPFLQGLLVPRGFLARKEDPATRAAAATALGRLGTPMAQEALRLAVADKDVVVRTAATRALRGAI